MTRLINKEIVRSARAKAIAQRGNYAIVPGSIAKTYRVKNTVNGKTYNVDTSIRFCTCPEFKNSGYCKHYAMVQDEMNDEKRVAEMETAHADNLAQESEWEAENL